MTLLAGKRSKQSFIKAGLYGLFVTQSNDFALGLPIIKGIFQDTHPEYLKFFYLTGPAQVAWINPLAFLMIEYGKSEGNSVPYGKVLWSVVTNPLVFMTVIGLVVNVAIAKEPPVIGRVLESLGNVYDALALFTLGMAMSVPNLPPLSPSDGKIVLGLIVVKLIVSALLANLFVTFLHGNADLGLYAFVSPAKRVRVCVLRSSF